MFLSTFWMYLLFSQDPFGNQFFHSHVFVDILDVLTFFTGLCGWSFFSITCFCRVIERIYLFLETIPLCVHKWWGGTISIATILLLVTKFLLTKKKIMLWKMDILSLAALTIMKTWSINRNLNKAIFTRLLPSNRADKSCLQLKDWYVAHYHLCKDPLQNAL